MKGVHAEVSKRFTRSNHNYIITSRFIQGQRDLRNSTPEERKDIVARWGSETFDLKGFDTYKGKERATQKASDPSNAGETSTGIHPGWLNHFSSFDERIRDEKTRFYARKDSWKKNLIGSSGAPASASPTTHPTIPEDAEFEQAIQASVRETSRGNAEEDAAVEEAIRHSVSAVRQQGELPEPVRPVSEKDPSIFNDAAYQITDGEYQDLIEHAIRESMGGQSGSMSLPQEQGIVELDATNSTLVPKKQRHTDNEDDGDLQRAIEDSKKRAPELPPRLPLEDDELERAIAASREEADRERTQRTEEDIVMEYVKKQSLAEEEFRRQKSKGKRVGTGRDDEDDEEDLKRAMEESLKMGRDDNSGPSGLGGF